MQMYCPGLTTVCQQVFKIIKKRRRITIGRSMSRSCRKLSCIPDLRNYRESPLNGERREAVVILIG
jgi:hypothetical protein